MSDFTFDVSQLEKNYSSKDFQRSNPEPREDLWFEFQIASATLGQARIDEAKGTGGYLQLSLKVQALDANGTAMFTKFVNIAPAVSYQGHKPHPTAGSIFASTMKAFYPEFRPYDEIALDPVNSKKRIYLKNGNVVSKEAFKTGEAEQANAIEMTTNALLGAESANVLADMIGRKFFAKLQKSKDGQYTNVRPIVGVLENNTVACYSSAEAYGKEA